LEELNTAKTDLLDGSDLFSELEGVHFLKDTLLLPEGLTAADLQLRFDLPDR
jgi:hypothetical protein